MPEHLINTGFAAGLAADNVFPATRKNIAHSFSLGTVPPFGIDPSSVKLHEASGGFNCVIEVSANRCLRQLLPQLTVAPVPVTVPPEIVQETLRSLGRPSTFEEVGGDMVSRSGISVELPMYDLEYFSVMRSEPSRVIFTYPRTTTVRLKAELLHYARVTPRGEAGIIEAARSAGLTHTAPSPAPIIILIGRIGDALLDLSAGYHGIPDQPRTRVEIVLEHFEDKSAIQYSSEVIQHFFEDHLTADLNAVFQRARSMSNVQLTPTLSLTGDSPTITVDEITNFDVKVFHVSSSGGSQAIAAAFDVLPGCHGIIEDVEHFIGNRDYGVITDEYVVERVFKYKWRIGGFDRSFRLNRRIEVTRDGRAEDADLRGRLDLDSLDAVVFATDSDTRYDFIQIGGRARSVPTDIVLSDGTVLGPGDVDFGQPQVTPWSIATRPLIEPDLSSDPEVRDFQIRAHTDAFRHISRPFATFTLRTGSVVPQYTRLEAVTRHLFFLGQIPMVF